MSYNSDNCFLFLGKTGVGKSLCAKLLTENKNIEVSDSKSSVTSEITSYNAHIPSSFFKKELKYQIVDTPGLNDSFGNDKKNMQKLKSFLTNKSLKIKGAFIFLNFQDVRFDDAEKTIIKEIYKLIPINSFWKYITIVFTHFFGDRRISPEKKKTQTEISLRKSFEDLIIESYEKELIDPIKSKDLRIEYIDVYDPDIALEPEKTKEENNIFLKKIKNIIKELSEYEPLYSEIKEETKNEKIIEKVNYDQAILYNCKVKIYSYYNQQGKIIKQKGIILEKEKDKVIERSDFKDSLKAYAVGIGAGIAAIGCYIGVACFPPASPALVFAGNSLVATEYGAYIYSGGKFLYDKSTNNVLDNSKQISDYDDN